MSLRTLDRMASEGRIKRGKALRKTRPIVVFSDEDLASLRAEIAADGQGTKVFRRLNTPPKDTVGFRLDPLYLDRLTKAGAREGLSPGEYARRLVTRGLEDTTNEQFAHQVKRLRESLADAFYALLTMKFGSSEAEAESFIKDTILKD
ncbi:MAG TPA: hypothetical protein VG944_16170 [Fimbriimonas sp.]|nr:hypothetical protein [Fimbriimonas sp.]